MNDLALHRAAHARVRRWAAAAVALCAALATSGAHAQNGLQPFKNWFVTGDYVAAGVGLRGTGVNGYATGSIRIEPAQIPAGAEVVAAYLYWQTVGPSGGPDASVLRGAQFKKNPIDQVAVLVNPAGSSPCWSNGGGTGSANGSRAIYVYRADVLPLFPRVRPTSTDQPVQVSVAGTHEVRLPDAGNSNQLPSTLGAGLVIVYRQVGYDDAGRPRQPLRAIVVYDGGYTMDNRTRGLTVTLEGFYEASRTAPGAKLTSIVANGQPNFSERVLVQSTNDARDARLVATNPFGGAAGAATASANGYDVVTFPNLPLEPGAMKAKLIVDAGGNGSFDCLTWGAIVVSTEVQDRDADGLLDVWEQESEFRAKPQRLANVYGNAWPLPDPGGVPLPNLERMGANANVQDVFVEIDYMVGAGHTHLPAKSALDSVARAFRDAAPRPSVVAAGLCAANAPRGACPINVHFDVGPNYQPTVSEASCANASTWTPSCAIIRTSAGTKGGDRIPEVPCTDPARCAFPGYAGVVGWKNGLRAYRDQLVDATTRVACATPDQPGCEPRFPYQRKDIFRYVLFAHALGLPAPQDPLAPDAPPRPRKTSGVADSGGGDALVTLGLWDDQTGSAFVQGATLMHELGHTFGLRHGGVTASGALEANCKPNYQSVMNYLFQVRGLLDASGTPVLDFSRQSLGALSETAGLSEAAGLGATSYLPRWYAPLSTSFVDRALNTSPATRRCDGSRVAPTDVPMVRVDADPRARTQSVPNAVDWNGDGAIAGAPVIDVNFDGTFGALGAGANDFATLDLRQTGARRAVGSETLSRSVVDPVTGLPPPPGALPIGGGLSLDSGYGDLGYGDLGYGDLGYGDLGYGDLGYGDLGYGDLGYGDLGYGDLGYGDLGYGDLGVPAEEPAAGEVPLGEGDLNLDTAGSLGNAPSALTAVAQKRAIRLSWLAPHVGTALSYQVYRVVGTGVTAANFAARLLVGNVPGGFTSIDDVGVKNNVTYTYFVVATVANPDGAGTAQSGVSNYATLKF